MASKKKEIVFIKSPTGDFKLGYSIGQKVAMATGQADELIDKGFAITAADAEKKAAAEIEAKEAARIAADPTAALKVANARIKALTSEIEELKAGK